MRKWILFAGMWVMGASLWAQQFVARAYYADTSGAVGVTKLFLTDSMHHYYVDSLAARPDSTLFWSRSGNSGPLIMSGKRTYVWDGSYRLQRRISYSRNASNWRPASKDTLFWSSGGQLDSIYSYAWNPNTNQWEPNRKRVYFHSSNGQVDSFYNYMYNSGSFQLSEKEIYHYQNGLITSVFLCQFNNSVMNCDTITLFYDNAGVLDSIALVINGNHHSYLRVLQKESSTDLLCNNAIVNVGEIPNPVEDGLWTKVKAYEVIDWPDTDRVEYDLVAQWTGWRKEVEYWTFKNSSSENKDRWYYYFRSPTFTGVQPVAVMPAVQAYVRQSTLFVRFVESVQKVVLTDLAGRVYAVRMQPGATASFYVPASGVYLLTIEYADGNTSTLKVPVY